MEAAAMVERTTEKERTMKKGRRVGAPAAVTALLAAAFAIWAGPASADTGLVKLEAEPTATQAGGHPDIRVSVEYKSRRDAPYDPCHCDDVRQIAFHFPTGFIGDPHVVPKCDLAAFTFGNCAAESQVGLVELGESAFHFNLPLYNMETHPDQAGQLGFTFPLLPFPVFSDLSGRTESDYGLDSTTAPIVHLLTFPVLGFTIWGVPADPSHDFYRFITPLQGFGECGGLNSCGDGTVSGIGSNATPAPYLQSPTTCGVPLTYGVDMSYYNGDVFHAETPWPATTGCNQLAFNPSLSATPTTNQADTAAGIDIDLKVPQTLNPNTPTASQIRAATVTLPQGFSVNPNAADGKTACSNTDTAIGTRKAATCPEFAKIGTTSLNVSALPGPIPGALYLGEPLPGERYRLVLTADGFGTHVKLLGTVHADPSTGQVVISFVNLPQSPLQEFVLHIFGSERGTLATPEQCGTYPVVSEFVPWDDVLPNQVSTSFFNVETGPNGRPCPNGSRPFDPELLAGSSNPTAGMHTPFNVKVSRADGDQNLSGVTITTPPGFLATLKGVAYCPQSAIDQVSNSSYSGFLEQASPSCPAASQIGTASAGAGAGTRPLYAPGRVYLAGPYKGAPLSLLVVVPAVSGPYDLGNVAIRVATYVDPVTAQVTAVSDPLPQILEGIPLRARSVEVQLDRPGFTLNPTNCDPFAIKAVISGDEGAVASPSRRYQVSNCAQLGYSPNLTLRLTGGVKRRGHPAIHAVFTARSGEANTRKVTVTLPKGELLDNAHIGTVCTRVDFAKDACPAGSQIGTAEASSPVLDEPLKGLVYLRSSPNPLPDLVMDLRGQIHVELSARIDSVKGRLRANFETVPDAPVDRVTVDLEGGSKGLLTNSESLCGQMKRANAEMEGQNGVVLTRRPKLRTSCSSKARHKRHSKRHSGMRKAD
jgi:hypothetical protein